MTPVRVFYTENKHELLSASSLIFSAGINYTKSTHISKKTYELFVDKKDADKAFNVLDTLSNEFPEEHPSEKREEFSYFASVLLIAFSTIAVLAVIMAAAYTNG